MPSDLSPYEKFVSEIAPSQQSCEFCIYAKLVNDIAFPTPASFAPLGKTRE